MQQKISLIVAGLFVAAQAFAISFEKEKINIGGKTFEIEVARSPEQQRHGLMYRRELPDNTGMMFVYPTERVLSFWMKNTFIPLSIGFFNNKKELVDIQDMTPVTSEMQVDIPTYKSRVPAMYALEVPKGWFGRQGFKLMSRFDFVKTTK